MLDSAFDEDTLDLVLMDLPAKVLASPMVRFFWRYTTPKYIKRKVRTASEACDARAYNTDGRSATSSGRAVSLGGS
jgi:hypothetical protein